MQSLLLGADSSKGDPPCNTLPHLPECPPIKGLTEVWVRQNRGKRTEWGHGCRVHLFNRNQSPLGSLVWSLAQWGREQSPWGVGALVNHFSSTYRSLQHTWEKESSHECTAVNHGERGQCPQSTKHYHCGQIHSEPNSLFTHMRVDFISTKLQGKSGVTPPASAWQLPALPRAGAGPVPQSKLVEKYRPWR